MRRLSAFVTAALLAVVTGACSSADVSLSGPSATKCQVSANTSPSNMPATGGSGVLSVSTTRDCTWDASSAAGWVTFTDAANGQGSADVSFRVAANPDPSTRRGTLTVNGAQVSLSQDGTPCRFTVSPAEASMPADGGTVTVRVETGSGACSWSSSSQLSWVHVGSGSQGGSGSTTVRVDANAGTARRGSVVIAGQTISIEQEAPVVAPTPAPPSPTPPTPTPPTPPAPTPPPLPGQTCTYRVSPTRVSAAASGDTGVITLTTSTGCAWTASSDSGWITLSPTAGAGPAALSYVVAAASSTSTRSGVLTIAGETVTVTQAGVSAPPPPPPPPAPSCTYAISPTSASIGEAATTLNVAVTTQSGCAWSVQQVDKWMDSGSSGTGSGTASVDVQRFKGGGQRVGTITIAGQTFTVTQKAGN